MNKENIESLNQRMDNRTQDQFAKDIMRDTQRELLAVELLRKDLTLRGKQVNFFDYGMDNSGKVVIDRKKVSAKADYLFKIDGKDFLFEIKVHSNKIGFCTFKKSNLIAYKKENAYIVIVEEDGYTIISPKGIDYIMKYINPKIYQKFSPNDLAYRMERASIQTLINYDKEKRFLFTDWHKKMGDDIELHKDIFKRRKERHQL